MLVIALAYFLGAIPAGFLLNRALEPLLLRLVQLPAVPSAWRDRVSRLLPRALSSFADLTKGALVIWIVPSLAHLLSTSHWAWLTYPLISPGLRTSATLVTMVLAHVLSVYLCGWGGRGIATALGGCLVITPLPALAAILLWFLLLLVLRSLRLSALAASFALPLCILFFHPLEILYAIAAFLLALLAVLTHSNSPVTHHPPPHDA